MVHAICTTLVKQNSAQCVSEGKSFPGGNLLITYKTANTAWRKRILSPGNLPSLEGTSVIPSRLSLSIITTPVSSASYCPICQALQPDKHLVHSADVLERLRSQNYSAFFGTFSVPMPPCIPCPTGEILGGGYTLPARKCLIPQQK